MTSKHLLGGIRYKGTNGVSFDFSGFGGMG